MTTQNRAWHVRGLPHWNDRSNAFLQNDMVAVGWPNFPDMSALKDLESIKKWLRDDPFHTEKPGRIDIAASTLNKFLNLMSIDDYIVFPDDRHIYFGKVSSNYYYDKNLVEDQYPHCRKVDWLLNKNPILRIDLTESLQSQLRYPRTIKEYNYDDIHAVVTSNS